MVHSTVRISVFLWALENIPVNCNAYIRAGGKYSCLEMQSVAVDFVALTIPRIYVYHSLGVTFPEINLDSRKMCEQTL